MKARVGGNGFGRIGRDILRCALGRPDSPVDVVAVNDLAPPATLAHLLAYDSTYGRLGLPVKVEEQDLVVGGPRIRAMAAADPAALPWGELDVDMVIEATDRFRTRTTAAGHLTAGARKVVITAPGQDADATLVLGVNEDSYTNAQNVLDGPHKDLRRARSAAVNMIPTSTGVATPPTAGSRASCAARPTPWSPATLELAELIAAKGPPLPRNTMIARGSRPSLNGTEPTSVIEWAS